MLFKIFEITASILRFQTSCLTYRSVSVPISNVIPVPSVGNTCFVSAAMVLLQSLPVWDIIKQTQQVVCEKLTDFVSSKSDVPFVRKVHSYNITPITHCITMLSQISPCVFEYYTTKFNIAFILNNDVKTIK